MSGIVECHCAICRKAAGGHAGFFFTAFRDEVEWTGEEQLTRYRSSPQLERSFCLHCGTAMTGANLIEADETIILAANTLEADAPGRIVAQEYYASRCAWTDGGDKAPRFDGSYPGWEELRP